MNPAFHCTPPIFLLNGLLARIEGETRPSNQDRSIDA